MRRDDWSPIATPSIRAPARSAAHPTTKNGGGGARRARPGHHFRVLDFASLPDVLAASKTCLTTCKHFPKVAEWVDALPAPPVTHVAADLRVMATPEREAYHHAEALLWQDEPCSCWDCQDAGVTERPLRFVPDEVHGVLDRAIDTDRNRVVVTGHWAHGDELARW